MVQRLPVKEDFTGSSPVEAEYSPIVKLVSRKNLAFAFYVRVVVGEKFKEYKQQTKKILRGQQVVGSIPSFLPLCRK